MNKQFLVIIAVIIVALFGVLMFTRDKGETNNASNNNSTAQATNHVVGAGEKNVTVVEYGDFQCPACKAYYPIVKQVKEDYGDQIKFQFRHNPLTSIHPNAFIGSRAAEAAGLQGKFWEMHDILYEQQDSWSQGSDPTAAFVTYATQLNLDVNKFKTDMTSTAVSDAINADLKAGQALGVNSTPTFVINGKKVEKNPTNLEDFKKLIDEAIASSNSGN